MFKTKQATSTLLLLSLTLGLVTATVWNTIALPALSGSQFPLVEILETTVSEVLTSILGGFLVVLTFKQLVPAGRWKWFWFAGKLVLLGACLFGGLAVVWLSDSSILPIRFNLLLALFTDLDFWHAGLSLPLQLLNWSWAGLLVMVLLATSVFLFLLLTGKALSKGQFHWPILTVCFALLLTLGVNNLETLEGNALLAMPSSLFSFPTLFWDVAPFLGVSVLWFALRMGEGHLLHSRRSWWVGPSLALVLCLDLATIVGEGMSLLAASAPAKAVMPFWPFPPLLAIGALGVALGLAFLALTGSTHVFKDRRES